MSWDKWDYRFLALAAHISGWSKDPGTKCGAVIVREDRTIASMGFNGFPMGIDDTYRDRKDKLDRVIHAEMNALLFLRERPFGYTLYTYPFGPCCRCAVHIIQSGIMRVVAPSGPPKRWEDSLKITRELFHETGVVRFVEGSFDPSGSSPVPPSDGPGSQSG